jgi:hypothetical protein
MALVGKGPVSKEQQRAENALPYPKLIKRVIGGRERWTFVQGTGRADKKALDADCLRNALSEASGLYRVPRGTISHLQPGTHAPMYGDGKAIKPSEPEAAFGQLLAGQLVEVARAAHLLQDSPLTEDVIVLLIHEKSRVNKRDIKKVLQTLGSLESIYLKPKE